MNPNYAQRLKKYLDNLLNAEIIFPIEITQWLSPLVIVSKKNDKLYICVDYRKLNSQTKKDPFPLPSLDSILDTFAQQFHASILNDFSVYGQKEDHLNHLKKCMTQCRNNGISFNPKKRCIVSTLEYY
jgi:hypothetical protein